ncbi:hypothetical protein FJR48_08650 [Sulfurimonas lithotrophica]|uniref:Uncharacterized protein n=1 Tax=Sulfurimonas lithotrophica TaxID=2590022 RepID=A0A5P8P2B0_9BACT|nr:hypothetical protein [Sulfurimonas lithotrophica]QFR49796.1 hypothetical protein FJR48_08650 [Sulfurimonas lithotrophica]
MINYEKANEVLFVLYALDEQEKDFKASKISIQKIVYLANILLPIKKISLAICEFITYHRGPFSSELQNILDQLSMFGLIDIIDFEKHEIKDNISYINYKITDLGKKLVSDLVQYKYQKEKYTWFNIICKVSILYTVKLKYFDNLDGIVKLVYQDPTFLSARNTENKIELIDIEKFPQTKELIDICIREYADKDFTQEYLFEMIVLTMFEFYYSKYLETKDDKYA